LKQSDHRDLVHNDTGQYSTSDDVAHLDSDKSSSKRRISPASTLTASPPTKTKARPKNLGAVGGKGALATEPVIKPPRVAKNTSSDGFSTRSDDGVETTTRSKRPDHEDKHVFDGQQQRHRTGGTLGKIGGGRKLKEKSVPSRPRDGPGENEEEEEGTQQFHKGQNQNLENPKTALSPSPSKPKRAGKLGMIGGRPHQKHTLSNNETERVPLESRLRISTPMASQTANDMDDDVHAARGKSNPKSSASPSRSPAPTTSSHHSPLWPKDVKGKEKGETAEEKANRKREELKRRLQSKAAAPAKRRRF